MLADRAVEEAARASYGRLLAYLSSRCGDVTGAEDALGEAFYRALRDWRANGLPPQPEAWLLRVAYNYITDQARRQRVRTEAMGTLIRATQEAQSAVADDNFPDDRLKLLFVCAHPAIDAAIRTPLLLQLVLGFDAARIGSAFLVAPATMGQRLVRAKTKIRDARISFDIPDITERPARLEAVLEAIYALYTRGWDDVEPNTTSDFADEALYLARLVVKLLPDEPEARGLLALILYCEARRPARRGPDGAFIPLAEQDTTLWSTSLVDSAEHELEIASTFGGFGRFQCEAAIQSAHIARKRTGFPDPRTIALFYQALLAIAPTVGARIGHAVAVAEWQGPHAGLALLTPLEATPNIATHQPYWAARAHLLKQTNQLPEAATAYDRAIGLTEDPAVRHWLLTQRPK